VVLMKISRFLLKTMSLLVISVLISFHLMLLKSLLLFLNQISDIFFALSLYLNDLLEYCVFLYVFVFVCVCVCVCVCWNWSKHIPNTICTNEVCPYSSWTFFSLVLSFFFLLIIV
jgi:hypothetical protein